MEGGRGREFAGKPRAEVIRSPGASLSKNNKLSQREFQKITLSRRTKVGLWSPLVHWNVKPSNSITQSAAHVDALLADLAEAYNALPRRAQLAAMYREAAARVGLPGSYVRRGIAPRSLAEQFSQFDLERIT